MSNPMYRAELYKLGSRGVLNYWMIEVVSQDDSVYEVTYSGKVDGKIKETVKEILPNKQFKNAGMLAIKKARTKAEKKIREGYSDSKEAAQANEGLKSGMQALTMDIDELKDYHTHYFLAEEKLNGVRGTYHLGLHAFISKGQKEYDIPHLLGPAKYICEELNLSMIDIEFYVPGLPLNEITSLVKTPDKVKQEQLKMYIFDCIPADRPAATAKDRKSVVAQIRKLKVSHVEVVTSLLCKTYDQIKTFYETVIAGDGEGIVLRNPGKPYMWGNKNSRCDACMKVKPWYDGEFKVVDYHSEGRIVGGVKEQLIIFWCEAENGKRFKATPEWDVQRRIDFFKNRPKIESLDPLKVRYRERTVNGLPFHAVAEEFRDKADMEVT